MGQTVRAQRKVQHIRTVYPTTPHGSQEKQGRTFLRAARRAEVEAMVDVWVKVQTRIRWPSYSPPIRGHPTDDPMRGFRPGSAFYLIGILRHTSACGFCQSGLESCGAPPWASESALRTPPNRPRRRCRCFHKYVYISLRYLHYQNSYPRSRRKNTTVNGRTRTPSRTTRLIILRRLKTSTGRHIIPHLPALARLPHSPMWDAALVVFS